MFRQDIIITVARKCGTRRRRRNSTLLGGGNASKQRDVRVGIRRIQSVFLVVITSRVVKTPREGQGDCSSRD